ncbi:MAG: DUF1588 domain-containing protein, partial [Myxococcota bacterium]
LPPPPDDILPPAPDGESRREVWDQHTESRRCTLCHQHINPAGFVLEDFDVAGLYRTEYADDGYVDSLVYADASLERAGLRDMNGGASFSEAMADSPVFRSCFARAWVEYALGRPHRRSTDEDAIASVTNALSAESLLDALADLAASPLFLTRNQLGEAR